MLPTSPSTSILSSTSGEADSCDSDSRITIVRLVCRDYSVACWVYRPASSLRPAEDQCILAKTLASLFSAHFEPFQAGI